MYKNDFIYKFDINKMIVKFISSLPKNNIFIYRNIILYFTVKDRNLFINYNTDNEYLEDAITRLKNILNEKY